MEKAVTITARHLRLSDQTQDAIRTRAARLERFHGKIQRCNVVVSGPGRHHRHGGPYEVHIDLRVPGAELVVSRCSGDALDVVIHHAFDIAQRQLQGQIERRRGQVKHHEGRRPLELNRRLLELIDTAKAS